MKKKLSFQLPLPIIDFADKTVSEIESLIKQSVHNEFGGVLCLDANNKLYLENVVKGGDKDEGIEEMPEKCEEGNRRVGSFHTHPRFDPEGEYSVERISSSDYYYHESHNDSITCIGHASTEKLTCMISGIRNAKEQAELEHLISELGEAEVYWQMIQAPTRKKAEEEIKKEGHYDKINKYYNWLNVDLK